MRLNSFDNSLQLFNSLVNDIFPEADEHYRPALTILEHEDRFVIECDLPGVTLDDVDVEVHNGVLEIAGQRQKAEVPEGSSVRIDERPWAPFRRRIKLDKSVDTASVTADYVDGVLVVTAPRRVEALPQKIAIRRASAD